MRRYFSCYCVAEGKIPHRKSLKKSIQEYKKRRRAASFGNLSMRSDRSKIKFISNEIEKLGNGKVSAEVFTHRELRNATQNFHSKNLVGEGGFGRVYRGHIEGKNIDVAVKQLDRNGFQGNNEFLVEVLVLSHLDHRNLVNLVGYCAEGSHRLLVYDYMPNGSLEDHLLNVRPDQEPLNWSTRMKIALGAAKGLEYLHEKANPPVIYRDFKASNILLDKGFNPKLSDFGLAKLGPIGGDTDHISTRVMGTYGYCAPEYAATGQLTTKSDVYSFGVVFLEMITGRRVIDVARPSEEQNLITWAEPLFKDKKNFHLMADPLLNGNYPVKAFFQALAVAAMCLQEEAGFRPSIGDVVTALGFLSADKSHLEDDSGNHNDDDDDVIGSSAGHDEDHNDHHDHHDSGGDNEDHDDHHDHRDSGGDNEDHDDHHDHSDCGDDNEDHDNNYDHDNGNSEDLDDHDPHHDSKAEDHDDGSNLDHSDCGDDNEDHDNNYDHDSGNNEDLDDHDPHHDSKAVLTTTMVAT